MKLAGRLPGEAGKCFECARMSSPGHSVSDFRIDSYLTAGADLSNVTQLTAARFRQLASRASVSIGTSHCASRRTSVIEEYPSNSDGENSAKRLIPLVSHTRVHDRVQY